MNNAGHKLTRNTDTVEEQYFPMNYTIFYTILEFKRLSESFFNISTHKFTNINITGNIPFNPRTDATGADIRPPEGVRRERENRGVQRRESWHDYSFIPFTPYVQVVISWPLKVKSPGQFQ